jgi:hypothetical protein
LRRIELILAIACAFAVFWPVVFGSRPRRGIVAGALSIGLVAQFQLEGFRWQMLPLYLVAIGLAIGDIFYIDRSLDWSSRLIRGVLGAIGLVLAAALPVVLPVPQLPVPSGPEAVGTTTVALIDRARDNPYGDRPGGPREFVAQVWYPAIDDGIGEALPWSENWEVVAPALSENIGLPSWFLDHTRYANANAKQGLTLQAGTFPVVIFSHDLEGVRSITVNQIEQLVSSGYIVIAPDHTYVAAATVLGEGEIVLEDPDVLPDPAEAPEAEFEEAATQLIETLSADIITILDALDVGAEGPFAEFAGAVDLNRIGVYGHGAGGGAAVRTCLVDEEQRCAAVLGMDPWVEPLTEDDLRMTMTRPALYMRSEGAVDTPNDALLRGIAARGDSLTYWLTIEGASHNDFTVAPLLSPFTPQFGLTGPIAPGRIVPIVDNYLLGFFDVFLLGTGSAALDSVSFPEVSVSVIQPPD